MTKIISSVCAAALLLAPLLANTAVAAGLDSQFQASLAKMMNGMKDGPVSRMSAKERKALIACVGTVFGKIPDEKKKFIVAAGTPEELRSRFDAVGLENRAKLKQEVRDRCAEA